MELESDMALDQPGLLELRADDVLVERLHDVFVGALLKREHDVLDVAVGGAKDNFRAITPWHRADCLEAIDTGNSRQIPVEQDHVRHRECTSRKRGLAIWSLATAEREILDDRTSKAALDATSIDYET